MRKNGSRFISLKQYRATDLFLFAVILVAFDLIDYYATVWLAESGAVYLFAITVPMVLMVMMRWGWPAIFYAVGDAVLQTVLMNPGVWQSYLSFILGYSAILLLLIPLHFAGKQKIAGKWYFTALSVLAGWLISNLVCTTVQCICGLGHFGNLFLVNIFINVNGLLSLVLGIIILLVVRRFDGLFEDQIHYLKRQERERKEMMEGDSFGDTPLELNEDTLSILKKRDEDIE